MESRLGTYERPSTSNASLSTPSVGAYDVVAPVWMFVGLVAGGSFVVGSPEGVDVLLDEVDVRILDAISPPTTPTDLADRGLGAGAEDIIDRCSRLIAAGCAQFADQTNAPMAEAEDSAASDDTSDGGEDELDEELPVQLHEDASRPDLDLDESATPAEVPDAADEQPTERPTIRARIADAYRLSSKLRPLRDVIDKVKGSSAD
jgi:hypothetical protein